ATAPQYGYPAYPESGNAMAPQYGYPAYSQPPASGTVSWAMGFLSYIPIPYVSFLIAGIVMAAVYPSQRRRGPVAAENARFAANWGLTMILAVVVLVGSGIVLGPVLDSIDGPENEGLVGVSIALLLVSSFGIGITHLVMIIIGVVRAGKAEVFRCPLAIRFIRTPHR